MFRVCCWAPLPTRLVGRFARCCVGVVAPLSIRCEFLAGRSACAAICVGVAKGALFSDPLQFMVGSASLFPSICACTLVGNKYVIQ